MGWLIRLLLHVFVFGVALTFAVRQIKHVRVEPRSALPLVALVFALLNSGLYWFVSGIGKLVTPFLLWLLVPFLANAFLLWLTDRLLKQFKIEGLRALAYTSAIVTVAHFLLRIAHI